MTYRATPFEKDEAPVRKFRVRTAVKKLMTGARVRWFYGQTVFRWSARTGKVYLKYPGMPGTVYGTLQEFSRQEWDQEFVLEC